MRKALLKSTVVLVAVCAALLFLVIESDNNYVIFMATTVFMYASLASSLDLLIGLTGRISFAHAAFFGCGAYGVGVGMMRLHLSFPAAAAASVGVTALLATILGAVTIRVRGLYFALATTSLGVAFVSIVELPKLIKYTGGATGLTGYPAQKYFAGPHAFYYTFLGVLAFVLIVRVVITHSHLGMRMLALRDDEELARSLGIYTNPYKVFAFAVASSLAALTGSFFAEFLGVLAPAEFDIWQSFSVVVWVLVGGTGWLFGPVVGVALLWTIPQQLHFEPNLDRLIYGTLLIVVISVSRGGLVGLGVRTLRSLWRRRAAPASEELAPGT